MSTVKTGHPPTTTNEPAFFWEAPILFDDIQTPEISADYLPSWVGAFVKELSASAQTPESFGTLLAFSTLATCLQGHVCVSPHNDSYREPINIWTVGVMPPGSRKTFVQEQLTEPLADWEIERATAMRTEIAAVEAERAIAAKRIERLQNEAAKKSDALDRLAAAREVAQLLETMPAHKRAPRLFTSDCTPERFQSLLQEHNERMSVLSDEGGIFELMSGLYSDGKVNFDVFLQSHSGSRVRVDRSSREVWLNHPLSTFGLAVQPAVIEELSHGSKRQLRGKGGLARFLYCVPVSNIGQRDVTQRRNISSATRRRYHEGIRQFLNIQPNVVDGVELPRVWRLDDEAVLSWIAFQQGLEKRQGEAGDLSAISDWTGKLPGAVLRLAALCHAVEQGVDNPTIPRSTLERILDLADLLVQHAVCAFSIMGTDQALSDARYVVRRIRAQGMKRLKQNDIYRACHGRIDKMERLNKALSLLIDRHILSDPIAQPTGGRPSPWFLVNPAILEVIS